MMFRFLIFLSALTPATASEPHLRNSKEQLFVTEDDPCAAGSGVGCDKEGSFSVSKGMKCDGGFSSKGVGKKCTGGMKSEFSMSSSATSIVNDVAGVLADQMKDFVPMQDQIIPAGEEMEDMVAMDSLLEDAVDGFSKTIEFGGMIKASWGCKVTYEKCEGKVSKTVECGFQGEGGMGPKPDEVDAKFA